MDFNDDNNYYYNTPSPEVPKKKVGWIKGFLKGILFATVFGIVAGASFVYVSDYFDKEDSKPSSTAVVYKAKDSGAISSTTQLVDEGDSVEEIVENVMPSMVAITNTTEVQFSGFLGIETRTEDSCGTGIIIAQDEEQLYIVTNNHVIDGADTLTVTLIDNESVEAVVKGTDASMDLAVIIVRIADLKPETLNAIKVAVLGDSTGLRLGQSVVAIGNALGYGQTVTTGVVSAKDRSVTIDNISTSLLQTNAAINPGNSGGALLNMKGEVIGINSAKYSDTDVEGIGFAIPITDAQPIIENLISKEMIPENERGYLGIYGADVTKDIASVYNLPVGIYVSQLVRGGAAEKAGIVSGDVIVKVDDAEILTMAQLQSHLQYYRAGQEVTVTIRSIVDGKTVDKTYTVKLQSNTSR